VVIINDVEAPEVSDDFTQRIATGSQRLAWKIKLANFEKSAIPADG
jgi:hypothetical protein